MRRIWVYGNSREEIQRIIEKAASPCDIIAGRSVCAGADSGFPLGGLTPAISAAIRNELDLLLVSTVELLGGKDKAKQISKIFQSYGVPIKSASSCGINNS